MLKNAGKSITALSWLLLTATAAATETGPSSSSSSNSSSNRSEASGWAVGLVAGVGMDDTLLQSGEIGSTAVLGADLRWQTDWHSWFDFAAVDAVYLNGQWAHWDGEHKGEPDTLDVMAITVNWRWQPQRWFADAGVGFAHLSDSQYEEVHLSGENQFALDFATGYDFDSGVELSLRYRHYSNGYTDTPNPGLDVAVVLLTIGF